MIKRKWHIGWLGWTAVFMAAAFLLSSILALVSMLFPYAPSQRSRDFCHYVLPPVFFALLFGLVFIGNLRTRHGTTGKKKMYEGSWLKLVLGYALASIAWAWMMPIILAVPAKFLATKNANVPVIVDHLEGFRLNYDYWTWIYFDRDGNTNRFMWTRSNPLLPTLKHGDCVMLHAREWSLGIYVDSITKSNACKDQS